LINNARVSKGMQRLAHASIEDFLGSSLQPKDGQMNCFTVLRLTPLTLALRIATPASRL
jgi:hypothetical protein